MKIAVIRRDANRVKHLSVEEAPEPIAAPGQITVRVSHVGICGSDLHGFRDSSSTAREDGLAMGHEISGHVEDLGEGVTGPATGTLVTIDPQLVCGRCVACLQGWISICEHKRVLGSSLRGFEQGGLQQVISVDATLVHAVPEAVGPEDAALVEPLSNAWHVIDRAQVSPEDLVVIIGAGPLGLCMIQCLRARGVKRIVVSEPSAAKRDIATAMGASNVVDAHIPGQLETVVASLTDGVGADVVVESVGVSTTYQQALDLARKRGKVMFFGAITPVVELPLLRILHRELELIGCTGANDETGPAIRALADGTIDLSAMPRASAGLADAEAAMGWLTDPNSGIVKLFIQPSR